MMVCSRRAPMFSEDFVHLRRNACAISMSASSVKRQLDAFGLEQRHVLLDQRVFRLLQDADEIRLR